jgi:hypothetical protein
MISDVKNWLNQLSNIANVHKVTALSKGEKYIWHSPNKNKDIKRKFSEEGEKLATKGRLSSRSSGKSTGCEWLYDFTLREFSSDNHFIGVPLVVEIELSDRKPKGLVYDFNKLLQSDADHRVFIFQQKNQAQYDDAISYIVSAFDAYIHKCNSKYLVACWLTSEYRFIYKEMNGLV